MQTRCDNCRKRCVYHDCPLHNECYCGRYRRLKENEESDLSSAVVERNLYKTLYEQLLDRLTVR